jgi:hypothetical protein
MFNITDDMGKILIGDECVVFGNNDMVVLFITDVRQI